MVREIVWVCGKGNSNQIHRASYPHIQHECFSLDQEGMQECYLPNGKFFWSSSLDRKAMHWVSWEQLTTPKCKGGMGFRDMHQFNLAMLGKQGWRLLTQPDTLCSRVLKGRYFSEVDFMDATLPKSASKTWRAIMAGREALQAGLIKRIGDGPSTSIWTDRWIPGTISMMPLLQPSPTTLDKVSDLIDSDNWSWRQQVVRDNFIAPDA